MSAQNGKFQTLLGNVTQDIAYRIRRVCLAIEVEGGFMDWLGFSIIDEIFVFPKFLLEKRLGGD